MKYAYIVTRISKQAREGFVDIPNLGVHSNFKKAYKHFSAVAEDRNKNQQVLFSSNISFSARDKMNLLEIAVCRKTGEEIRLERWALK